MYRCRDGENKEVKENFKVCCGSGIECSKDQGDEKEEKNPAEIHK